MGKGTHEALLNALEKKVIENPNRSRNEAIKAVLQEFYATGPAPDGDPTGPQLQNALNEYLPTLKKTCPTYNAPPMDPDTMERRYEYSEKCRTAMMTIIEEEVMRRMLFKQTAERMFKDNFGEQLPDRVDPRRWIDRLMKIGNSDEVQYHNEEVVALAMLGNANSRKDPNGKDLFRQTRYNHYINNLHLSKEEAGRKAEEDLENGMDRLRTLVLQQMKEDCPTPQIADQARDAILTGTADQLPGGLLGAYRKIMNPGNYLAWNALDITKDFAAFGRSIGVEDYKKNFRPYEMNSVAAHDSVISHVANPFYAILDGATLANQQVMGLQMKSKEEKPDFSAAMCYGGDIATGFTELQNELKHKKLPRFALKVSDDRAVFDLDNDISIYSNQRGRTVIIVSGPVSTENGLNIPVRTDAPGQLLNRKFADKMAELQRESVAHDEFMHSSWKYRSMKSALNSLAGTRIPDNISKKQARKLEKRVKDLQKATKAYLERKEKQFRKRGTQGGKNNYEKARYAFAKKMNAYLNELADKAKYIREHAETMEKVVSAETSEAKRMRKSKGRLVLRNPELTPFQRSVHEDDLKFEKDQEEAARAQREKEEAEKEAARQKEQAEKEKQANEGDALDEVLVGAEKKLDPEKNLSLNEAPKEMGPALKSAAEQAKKAYLQALDAGDQKQIRTCGQNLLATNAVWEMIRCGYGMNPEIGDRLRNIAEGGQLNELVKEMKKNTKFKERLETTDMSSWDAFNQNASTSASIVGKYAVKSLLASKKRKADNENRIGNQNQRNSVNQIGSQNRKGSVNSGMQAGG